MRELPPILEVNYTLPGPVATQFFMSEAFIRGIRGPVGSGKSTVCVMDMLKTAAKQRYSPVDGVQRYRGGIIRNTYGELRTTTLKTFHSWVPETTGQFLQTAPMLHRIRGETDEGKFDWEFLFLALDRPDHVKKLLSLELTQGWINEARETPKAILDALTARVGRWPRMVDGGAVDAGVIMDTNSPDQDHWWARMSDFADPEAISAMIALENELREMKSVRNDQKLIEFYTQPPAEIDGKQNDLAENLDNLPPGYYVKARFGKGEDWIKVYIRNEYHFVIDGQAIYTAFNDNFHVKDYQYNPNLPLDIGMDFGLTPAAVISQQTVMGQVRCLSEVVATRLGAKNFAREVKEHIASTYGPNAKIRTATGDPAGDAAAQTDEITVFQMLASEGLIAKPASTNDIVVRVETVNQMFSQIIDGQPALAISPNCRMLRKACAGGYHYRRVQIASELRYEQVPNKNMFSHVAEALQYNLMGIGKGKETIKRPEGMRQRNRPDGYSTGEGYF